MQTLPGPRVAATKEQMAEEGHQVARVRGAHLCCQAHLQVRWFLPLLIIYFCNISFFAGASEIMNITSKMSKSIFYLLYFLFFYYIFSFYYIFYIFYYIFYLFIFRLIHIFLMITVRTSFRSTCEIIIVFMI